MIAEIAILTSRKEKIKRMIAEGSTGAKRVLEFIERPEFFLSTVQVGITLMSIMIGIYSGSSLSEYLSHYIEDMPIIGCYAELISNSIILIVVTYFTVLGEIVPKRIAMLYPEKVAALVSYSMYISAKITFPIVALLGISTKVFLKILGIKDGRQLVSYEELKLVIAQAENDGDIQKTEIDMLNRLMYLSDMQVGAIMTPRNKIVSIDIEDPIKDNIKILLNNYYNYFPVIKGDENKIIGILPTKSLIGNDLKKGNISLEKNIEDCIYIPEIVSVLKLLELFRIEKKQVAMVVDEYGDIEGIITLNDIFKVIVGDVAVQKKGQVPNVQKKSEHYYILKGNTLIEEVMKIMKTSNLPGHSQEDYRNIASFVLKQLNRVPKKGDNFVAKGWKFRVLDMDKHSIARVSMRKLVEKTLKKDQDSSEKKDS